MSVTQQMQTPGGQAAPDLAGRHRSLEAGTHGNLYRFGQHWVLPPDMEVAQWYGRGPMESASDRKEAALPMEAHEPMQKPQSAPQADLLVLPAGTAITAPSKRLL